MKLISFHRKTGAAPEPGVLQKNTIYPLTPFGYADVESFIAAGAVAFNRRKHSSPTVELAPCPCPASNCSPLFCVRQGFSVLG